MAVVNLFHANSVAKILLENITWIVIFRTQAVTNHERNKKLHVMYAENFLAELTICVNISGLTLDNRPENVIISVHTVKNHSMVHLC